MTKKFALLDKDSIVIGTVCFHGKDEHVPHHCPYIEIGDTPVAIGMKYDHSRKAFIKLEASPFRSVSVKNIEDPVVSEDLALPSHLKQKKRLFGFLGGH